MRASEPLRTMFTEQTSERGEFASKKLYATASSPYRLAKLEAFELRMVEVKRLVLAGVPMGKTECFQLGPREGRLR